MESIGVGEGTGGERVRLVPWAEGDFWLLRRTNSPEMTAHLGGPEPEDGLAQRHRRYVGLEAGCMYRVVSAGSEETVGSIGYWEREWRGGTVWETGWGILPEFQGRGLAVSAARALAGVVRALRPAGGHAALHAFPDVRHAASNAVCRKAGFTLLGQARFEYPKGNWITSNDWYIDLDGDAPTGAGGH
ncbi:GNAT family protein [Streptomyces sp. NPDC006334]|uniref:GNAT family N-acetyltransferase n=1 Tax=Streptomyces sp. NPDC006334 TaxID=3156754 RepID=UPI00339EDDF6